MKYIKEYGTHENINITFVGDIMQHYNQIEYYSKNGYNMKDVFKNVKPIFDKSDFLVGCLETTFNGTPYTSQYPKEGKNYKLSTPDIFAKQLKKLGFNLLNVAQNHVLDYGEKGLLKTEEVLVENGLDYVGINKHLHDIQFKIKKSNVVFHNYTLLSDYFPTKNDLDILKTARYYHLPKDYKLLSIFPGINDLEPIENNINIITLHFGDEMKVENEEQITIADTLIKKGFDVVLGAHSHCPQSIKQYDNSLISYSLGNFISDQMHWILKDKPTEKGLILNININNYGEVNHVNYYLTESKVEENGKTEINILNSGIIKNGEKKFDTKLFDYSKLNSKYSDYKIYNK